MSADGDALLRDIAMIVHGKVPADLEPLVVELTARSVVLVLSTPAFVNNLLIVQHLQRENWEIRQALIAYQRAEQVRKQRAQNRRKATGVRKTAPKKAAAPRKTAPKRAATTNQKAFKRGASGN